jgi:hypothetical protein
MAETFVEEVAVDHLVKNPKWKPASTPGGPPANLSYTRVMLTAEPARVITGGDGGNGRITAAAKDGLPLAELIAFEHEAVIAAGQKGGRPGRFTLYDGNGKPTVNVSSADAHAVFGGNVAGRITAAGADGKPVAELIAGANEAIIAAGQVGRPARLSLYDGNAKESIRLDAAAGDIVFFNADCAEEFELADKTSVDPGTVLVLDGESVVRPTESAYDRRVVGVVSGAGNLKPALVLDKRSDAGNRVPVALIGKVFCKVDARFGAIGIGDLLTTATTPGHAMRASDPAKAFGAVLGKALRPLHEGRGLIPVLVALQ